MSGDISSNVQVASGDVRTATQEDLDRLTSLFVAGFTHDPLWRWAFADLHGLEGWWRFLIKSALRYPCVWVAGDFAVATVWIPPNGTEITPEEEKRVQPLLEELLGARAGDVLKLVESFDATHPRFEPHYYLSLLCIDPNQKGRGLGMAFLAENLQRIDEEGMPSYLESSNPANDKRYERLGYRRIGSFTTPDRAHAVSVMWRGVGG